MRRWTGAAIAVVVVLPVHGGCGGEQFQSGNAGRGGAASGAASGGTKPTGRGGRSGGAGVGGSGALGTPGGEGGEGNVGADGGSSSASGGTAGRATGGTGNGGAATAGTGNGGAATGGTRTGGTGAGGAGAGGTDVAGTEAGGTDAGGSGTNGGGGAGTGGINTAGLGGLVGTGGVGAAGAGGGSSCAPNFGGPTLVELPQGYCIDSTEVTRAEYQSWLGMNPTIGGQPTGCSGNTTLAPDASCMNAARTCQGTDCGAYPQVCIDWCDATAYCAAVGKHLCGRIGGGAVGSTEGADASLSEWYNACSSHGSNVYPYGTTYDGQACNVADNDATNDIAVATGSMAGCQSNSAAYRGVYDLGGNVWEWENSCDGTESSALCHLRGGSFGDYGYNAPCARMDNAVGRFATYDTIGFRCCSR